MNRRLYGLLQRLFTAVVSILFLLNSPSAQAQPELECTDPNSIYCDDSWHGGLFFHQLLSQQFPHITQQSEFHIPAAPFDSNTVHIWITPPGIHTQDITKALNLGAKILVFDETSTSLYWFKDIHDNTAVSIDSPDVPYAARINGNAALPVIQPSDTLIAHLGLSPDVSEYQLAFNHPSPILTQTQNDTQYHFFYKIQNTGISPGSLIVIRDESYYSQLMLNTFDNARFLLALIKSLCTNENSCRIRLYESGFFWDESPSEDTDKRGISSIQDALSKAQKKASDYLDSHKDLLDKIPWSLMLITIATVWSFIIFIIVIPWNRSRSK